MPVLLSLIRALAKFEKLNPPSPAARRRLVDDGLGRGKRYSALLAEIKDKAVGYAIFFETYSSFLALPTLYLEDIFVLPDLRRQKIGLKLFLRCLEEAQARGCGRMEWMVLDWNVNALRFYEKLGARHMKEWMPFRLEQSRFFKVLRSRSRHA